MKLDELLLSMLPAEEQIYQDFCKRAGKPSHDRGEISAHLQEFFGELLKRMGSKGHPGAFIGQFWGKYGQPEKKATKPKKKVDLRALSARLPYPLGYKLREFMLEFDKFEKGYGSSNFPYLVASLNGLAVRFIGILVICEYVHVLNASDAALNQEIVEGLRVPSDGTWKSLAELIMNETSGQGGLELIDGFLKALKARRPFEGSKKGINGATVTQDLVQFRNQLLHGTHRFSEQEVRQAALKIQLLYESLSFLEGYQLVVSREEGFFDCTGAVPVWSGYPVDGRPSWMNREGLGGRSETFDFSTPFLLLRSEGRALLPLGPMLHFVQRQEQGEELNELFFFNSWVDEQLEYISYRYARSQDHRQLELSYQDFLSFVRLIPITQLPQKAKLEFSGVAEYHLSHFVGRESILESIEQFMKAPERPYGVIKALGGMGKTALLSVFYSRFMEGRDWPEEVYPVWHFCASIEGRDHPVVFLRSVLAQLDEFLGGVQKEYPTSLDLLQEQLSRRLERLPEDLPEGGRVVIVVDALDEGLGVSGGLSIPGVLPSVSGLPACVSLLVSYRVDATGENELVEAALPVSSVDCYVIPGCEPLRGLSWEEMERMVLKVTGREELLKETLEAIWETAIQREDLKVRSADPFVLRFISDGLEEGTVDPERPESVPRSLTALFDQFWNQLPSENDYFLHRMLGMLAIMSDLGSDDMFAKVFSQSENWGREGRTLTPDSVAERRSSINKLLVFSGDMYRLFHSRFRDYVRRRFRPRDEALHLHQPLYTFCLSKGLDKDLYDLKYRVYHLEQLARHEGISKVEREVYRKELWALLSEESFFAEKFEVFQRTDLLWNDFSRSFSVFLPDPEGHPEEVWEQFAKTFHLSQRSHRLMSRAIEESHHRLWEVAESGDSEQVIRIALWGGTTYRRLWNLLLSAVRMRESGHDPLRLFNILSELLVPELKEADISFAGWLLERAQAPESLFRRFGVT